MNGNYYQEPPYPNYPTETYNRNNSIYPNKEEYIDNVINNNKGKNAKIYITIPGSTLWQDKELNGIIERSGKDHIIISNPNTKELNIIPLIYLAYITITEPLNYN